MKSRIGSIKLDSQERPLRAVIHTPSGIVHVKWRDVAGDWCWFAAGIPDAKQAAIAAIRNIEQMFPT